MDACKSVNTGIHRDSLVAVRIVFVFIGTTVTKFVAGVKVWCYRWGMKTSTYPWFYSVAGFLAGAYATVSLMMLYGFTYDNVIKEMRVKVEASQRECSQQLDRTREQCLRWMDEACQ